MSAKVKAAKDKRDAILLSSIEYFAKKQALRSLLDDDSATHVEATIAGKVGRGKVSLEIFGTLNVGSPTAVNSTSSAPTVDIVSALMAAIPYELRAKVTQRLISQYQSGKLSEDADQETRASAKVLLSKLKTVTPATRAGVVSFSME